MRGGLVGGLAALVLACTPAAAQEAKLVDRITDWSVYVHSGTDKICFAVSQPKTQRPPGVKRDPTYFYVSTWPKEKVDNEVSVKMGYPVKEDVAVEVTIGSDRFNLFSKGEGAYVESKETEQKLVEAMKRGSTMIVQGRSERGTLTTDEYSLLGVTAARERAAKECL